MKKILLIFYCVFISGYTYADMLGNCLNKVATTQKWKDGISGIFGTNELDDSNVNANKPQIYELLTETIHSTCGADLVSIAKSTNDRAIINFSHNNKDYGFDFSISEMFDGYVMRTGILVINKRDLTPNSILKLSDIPKKKKFFSDECSDWIIWDNLDDDAAVNVAGQAVFNEYGGSKNEFFLDFAEGDNRRAFPGLVLMDKTASTKETIVSYLNLRTGIEKTQQFAKQLKGTQCSNQGLSVYLVALDVSKDYTTASRLWQAVASVPLAYHTGAAGYLVATEGVADLAGLGAFLGIPVVGWVIGGVLLIDAGVIYGVSMIPQQIQDIQQVMILDGPYNL